MGLQIAASAHAPVEIIKPHKIGDRIEACSFKGRSLFWGFEWNERLNYPEKNEV